MDHALQKSASGQNNRAGPDMGAVARYNPGDSPLPVLHCSTWNICRFIKDQFFNARLQDEEVRDGANLRLHCGAIQPPVRLRARAAHRRAFRPVEHPELEPGLINDPSHQAIERIYLPNQMALPEPADCRVTGHFANRVFSMGNQHRFCAHARCRRCCFAACVPAPNHDDIIVSHRVHNKIRAAHIDAARAK